MLKLFCFIILLFASVFEEHNQKFDSLINNGYEKYVLVDSTENENFSFRLYAGKTGDKYYFAVSLVSNNAGHFKLFLLDEAHKKMYELETNGRHDTLIQAISIEKSYSFKVFYKDKVKNAAESYGFILVNDAKTYFENGIIKIPGLNKGITETKLKNLKMVGESHFFRVIQIVMAFIIVAGLITIITIAGVKKRLKPRRKFDNDYDRELKTALEKQESIKPEEMDTKPQEFNYEEELKNHGFNLNYSALTEEEKNDVMYELMKMRDSGKISEITYNKEVLKLWKK